MYYNIKRNNQIIASVVASGTYTANIMGEEVVNMSFTLAEPIEFLIGDYVEIYGQGFVLNLAPEEEKISSIQFNYTLQFESVKYELGKIQLLFPDSSDTLSISDFSVMGDARRILELIRANANRVQSGWKLGTIDETETKNFSFSAHNLLTALTMLADEFDNEFWIDKDKTIHFTTKKEFSGLTLQYGINKGLRSLYRSRVDSSNIVTRLFAYGSEKNISSEYRNYSKRLKMDVPYLEENVDKFGVIEHTEMFDDVYPNRKGKVTAINPDNFLQFTDVGLEFDLNSSDVLIPNTTVKVTFNTGQLAGYTLEVKEHGFNFNTKTFELNPSEQEKAITVPSELMRPAIGDEYVLTDIIMPVQYVTEAETELKKRSEEYLTANCLPRLQYNVVSDPFYFEAQNIDIVLGKTIKMIDADFNLDADIRVIRLTKNLQDQYDVSFELADEVQVSRIVREYLDDQAWQNQVINHQQQIDRNVRRNYLFSREILGNVFDGEGYFNPEKIKPLSIETKMLSVGARSQQFAIKNAKLTIVDNQTIHNDTGQIVHFTIEDQERVWYISESTIANIKDTFNYIYLKCQRNGNNANFVVTTEQIKVDQDPVYFYFEYGFLSSIIEGFRRVRTSYGFTDINGGEITTGRINGQNGELFIDIDNRKIIGKVEFLPDSPAYDQVNNSIQVGGRNLLFDSNKLIENNNYEIAVYKLSNEKYINGEDYTFTLWGDLGSDRTSFMICNSGGGCKLSDLIKIKDGVYQATFKWINTYEWNGSHIVDNTTINVYQTLYGATSKSKINRIKLEKGNKATDWTPAPEDVQADIEKSKQDSIAASQAYTNAQDELNRILAEAYADGVIDDAEQRLIDLTNAKVEAARMYADAQDALLKAQIEAYADGVITAEEAERIRQMQEYLAAAKAYADAQAELARIIAAAYADGIVSEEEARAIAEAQAKLEEAKNHAQGLVNNIKIGGRNLLFDSNKLTENNNYEIAVYKLSNEKYINGEDYTFTLWGDLGSDRTSFMIYNSGGGCKLSDLIKIKDGIYQATFKWTNTYEWDGVSYLVDNTTINVYQTLYEATSKSKINRIKLEKGNKATDWTPAPEDVQADIEKSKQDSIAASQAYTNAQDELNRILAEAYADGVIDESEQRLIDLTNAKVEAAKMYADAQDALLKAQIEAYADGVITAEEAERIRQMQEYLAAAKAYADAQAELARIIAAAYADGIVSEEEARAIAEAQAKLEEAKNHAQGLVNNIKIGGRNLLFDSNKLTENNNYEIAVYKLSNEKYINGEDYTFTLWGDLGSDRTSFMIYNSGGGCKLSDLIKIKDGVYQATFKWTDTYEWNGVSYLVNNSTINVYQALSNAVSRSKIDRIKLEKGNKATDWTPAPEDVQSEIDKAKASAEKALNELNNISSDDILSSIEKQTLIHEWTRIKSEYTTNYALAQLYGIVTRYYVNAYNDLNYYISPMLVDLNSNSSIIGEVFRQRFKSYYDRNLEILVAINDYLKTSTDNNSNSIGLINQTIDRINKITSFLGTTIDGNVVATGVVLVGDGNEGTGGMSGIRDQGQESIFLYSGQTFNNRYSAPFRVTHGGSVVMTNAYVSGHVTATSGTFNGTIYADNGRFSGEINAISGKIGSSVNYFTITDKGLESKNGWIWIGDTTNVAGNRARGVQIVKTDDNFNEPLIRIADYQTVPVHKLGMVIQVNGGASNTALILEGDLRITGKIIINGRTIT